MKYEIITDSSDMLVLTVNSRVIAISSDISEITRLITEDYANYRNRVKRIYNPAIIYPELDIYTEKEEKKQSVTADDLINLLDKKVTNRSLGSLFDL